MRYALTLLRSSHREAMTFGCWAPDTSDGSTSSVLLSVLALAWVLGASGRTRQAASLCCQKGTRIDLIVSLACHYADMHLSDDADAVEP